MVSGYSEDGTKVELKPRNRILLIVSDNTVRIMKVLFHMLLLLQCKAMFVVVCEPVGSIYCGLYMKP